MRNLRIHKMLKMYMPGFLIGLAVSFSNTIPCYGAEKLRYGDVAEEKRIQIYIDKSYSARNGGELVDDILTMLYDYYFIKSDIYCELYYFDDTVYFKAENQDSMFQQDVRDDLVNIKYNKKTSFESIRDEVRNLDNNTVHVLIVSDLYDSFLEKDEAVFELSDADNVFLHVIEWDYGQDTETRVEFKNCLDDVCISPNDGRKAAENKKDVLRMCAGIYYDSQLNWIDGKQADIQFNTADEYFIHTMFPISVDKETYIAQIGDERAGGGYFYYVKGVAIDSLLADKTVDYKNSEFLIIPQLSVMLSINEEIHEGVPFTVTADILYDGEPIKKAENFRLGFKDEWGKIQFWDLYYEDKAKNYWTEGKLDRGEYYMEILRFGKDIAPDDGGVLWVYAPDIVGERTAITQKLKGGNNQNYDIEIFLPDYIGQKAVEERGLDPLWQIDELMYEVEVCNEKGEGLNIVESNDGVNLKIIPGSKEKPYVLRVNVQYKDIDAYNAGIKFSDEYYFEK